MTTPVPETATVPETAASAGCTCAQDCSATMHYGNCPQFELVIPLVAYRCDCDCGCDG